MKLVDTLKEAVKKIDGEKVLQGASVLFTLGGLFVSSKMQGVDREKTKAELKNEILEELSKN